METTPNMYWETMRDKYGEKVADVATGSATPGCDLISLRDQGVISNNIAQTAAKDICGVPLNDAAAREINFCRVHDC